MCFVDNSTRHTNIITYLHYIIGPSQVEVHPSNGEGDSRERTDLGAIERVLYEAQHDRINR